jgi:hypothetical protein
MGGGRGGELASSCSYYAVFGRSEKALVDVTLDLGPSQPFRAFLCGFPSLWYSVLAMGKTKISSLHRLFSFYYLSPPF